MTNTHLRRKRGSISPSEIIEASMRLLDREGESALTFNKLGLELKSSPTAVYRHYASRKDILLALADHLDELSLKGYVPSNDWKKDLTELAWRAWNIAEQHPAAASICMGLITNGINELRAVDAVLSAIFLTGLDGDEAVLQYQVYSNMVLSAAMSQGMRLSSNVDRSREGWVQVYEPTDPAQFPYAEKVKNELRLIDYEKVFAKQIEMYIKALSIAAQ
jgi:AcrR family transcriptional regulator